MTQTRRPQESFWLPAHKLTPQRGTMLLLAVEKFGAVSWDYVLSLFEFRQGVRKIDQETAVNDSAYSFLRLTQPPLQVPAVSTNRLTGWPVTSASTISGTSATVTRP